MTMTKWSVGYFTFNNKNGLHYTVQSHILRYVTNKDQLIECVFFHIGKKGCVSNNITASIIVYHDG